MPENLTKEQNLAVELNRHISVKANAGSGKTKVLVDRYVRILKDSYLKTDVPKTTPYEIVAMTFTRKAAGEMLKKVVVQIENLKSKSTNPKEMAALSKIRNDLNAARISTIHSFASSLLRDYAVEANINPNFVEISESNFHRIKNEAFEYVITKIYQDNESELHKTLISFINRYSIKTLEDYANKLIYNKEYLSTLNNSGYYKKSSEEIVDDYENLFIEHLSSRLQKFMHYINIAFKNTSENDNLNYIDKSEQFSNLFTKFSQNQNINLEDLNVYFNELAAIYSGKPAVFEKIGLITYFTSLRCDSMNYDYAGLNDEIKECIYDYDEIKNSTITQIEDARFILEFANQVLKKTEEEKQKYAYLDFDDILIKTDELLSNTEIASKIQSKIKYIMVDEFQDTNPTQYSIIRKLVPGLFDERFPYPKSPEVFIVGDEKQSIYGFRGADVRIIKNATKFIEDHQRLREEDYILRKNFSGCSSKELSGNIELNASFRMKPALALFTNAIFSKLMAPDNENSNQNNWATENYKAVYSNIICAKTPAENSESYHQVLQNNNSIMEPNSSTDFGTVEFLISEKNDNYQSQTIASSITNLLISGEYQAEDICILSRDKVHIKELTNELSNREIPYFLHTGSGFFQTVEVRDVLSILSFLSDTKNDFELVSALKSPFFGLRDSDLLILTNIETEKINSNLWEKLQGFTVTSEMDEETCKRFEKAKNLINYLLRIAYRMSIPKLIRTLLKESGWMSKITPFKDKNQRIANIYKLIDFAREFEKQGFLSIYDFVKELETLEEISKEGEAGINTENAVNIMTIHSAKGLEFPVVYLYDTNRDMFGKLNTTGFFPDLDLGITFKNAKLINGKSYAQVTNIPAILAKSKNKEIALYEEIRLLYVAITRAIDKLFISAPIIDFDKKTAALKDGINKNSYISMIIDSIGNFPKTPFILPKSTFIMKQDELLFLVNNKIEFLNQVKLLVEYNVFTHENLTDNETNSLEKEGTTKHYYANTNLDDVMGHERDIFFSASKLSTFKKDRKRFWLEYILEMDDFLLKKSLNKFNDSESSGLLGQETGTAIHGVFEKMNRWYDFDNGIIKPGEFQVVLNDALTMVDSVGNTKIIQRVTNEVNNVMKTQLIQGNDYDFSTMRNEFALRYAFGRDFLSGVIDFLLKDTSGSYEIWDFKSDYLTKETIKDKADNYEEQIKLYAYLIYLLNDKPQFVKARLLFTRLALPDAKHDDWTHQFTWSAQEMENYKIELEERIKDIYNEYSL